MRRILREPAQWGLWVTVSLLGHLVLVRSLRDDEAGAVTIDWVGLTAGLLLLGIMVVHSIFNNGVSTLVSKVNSSLVARDVNISDNGDGSSGGVRTGNASDQACAKTGSLIVCMGPR